MTENFFNFQQQILKDFSNIETVHIVKNNAEILKDDQIEELKGFL